MRQTAQQLAAAKQGDQLVAQAEQAEALAKQQEKTARRHERVAAPGAAITGGGTTFARRTSPGDDPGFAAGRARRFATPWPAAQKAMQEAREPLCNRPTSRHPPPNQQAALQHLQQAAQAMASAKQTAAEQAKQARAQLQQAEMPLPNRQKLAQGYDWLKKLSEVAAKQTDVAQRAAAPTSRRNRSLQSSRRCGSR